MNKRQYQQLVTELRRSARVCGYSNRAFARWITNYLVPQIRNSGQLICVAGLIHDVLGV